MALVGFLGRAAAGVRGPASHFRRSLSTAPPPSALTDGELYLYKRISALEASAARLENTSEEETAQIRRDHKKVLGFVEESNSNARDAVRVAGNTSVFYLTGVAVLALGAFYMMRPSQTASQMALQEAQAAAQSAKEAAEAATASAEEARKSVKAM